MALITCPHCGKNVTDSVETCIHCGGNLQEKSVPEKEREYAALPFKEQQSLRKEFDSNYPNLSKYEKLAKYKKLLIWAAVLIFLAGTVVALVAVFTYNLSLLIAAVVLEFVGLVALIAVAVYLTVLNKKKLTELKRYQKWLEQEKRVHYTVILDEKSRKIFNDITID